jgi:hypothetical protein
MPMMILVLILVSAAAWVMTPGTDLPSPVIPASGIEEGHPNGVRSESS